MARLAVVGAVCLFMAVFTEADVIVAQSYYAAPGCSDFQRKASTPSGKCFQYKDQYARFVCNYDTVNFIPYSDSTCSTGPGAKHYSTNQCVKFVDGSYAQFSCVPQAPTLERFSIQAGKNASRY